MPAPARFKDRVVVITGASAGIGAAAARQFASEGAKVVLAARGVARLEAVADELRGRGAQAQAVATDISDDAQCAALLERAVAEFGGLHVLVNNAGSHARGLFGSHDAETHARMVDVNLRSPILMSRLALPHLRASGGGAIVNVASLAGCIPVPGSVTYSATKFGLRAFSRALAEELAEEPITVSVVSPGPVSTGFIMDDLEHVTDLTLSQPISTAEQVAADVLDCAADGRLERKRPAVSGLLTTAGYLWPGLSRSLRPMLRRRGAKARAKMRRKG